MMITSTRKKIFAVTLTAALLALAGCNKQADCPSVPHAEETAGMGAGKGGMGMGMMNHDHMMKMHEHMAKMREFMAQMKQETDPAKREQMMQQHMEEMEKNMKMMDGMMGGEATEQAPKPEEVTSSAEHEQHHPE